MEYIAVAGLICLACLGAWRGFGRNVSCKSAQQANTIEGVGEKEAKAPAADPCGEGGAAGAPPPTVGPPSAEAPSPATTGEASAPLAVAGDGALPGVACSNGKCIGPACFAAGTPVLTLDGLRAIESIRPGDVVLAANESTGDRAWQPVLATHVTQDREVLQIELHDRRTGTRETLSVTPDHPFWADGTGWVAAGELGPGDAVATAHGRASEGAASSAAAALAVAAISTRSEPTTVYNLEVDEFHTYFVGHGRAMVHNQCGPDDTAEVTIDVLGCAAEALARAAAEATGIDAGIAGSVASDVTKAVLKELGGKGGQVPVDTFIAIVKERTHHALHKIVETSPIPNLADKKAMLQKLNGAFKVVDYAKFFLKCGWKIGKGAVRLVQNTGKAIEEWGEANRASEATEKKAQQVPPPMIAKGDPVAECNAKRSRLANGQGVFCQGADGECKDCCNRNGRTYYGGLSASDGSKCPPFARPQNLLEICTQRCKTGRGE